MNTQQFPELAAALDHPAANKTVIAKPAPLVPFTHDQLRLNRKRGLQNLHDALEAAYKDAGTTAPAPVSYTREWDSNLGAQTMVWERSSRVNGLLEGLQVEVQQCTFDKVEKTDLCTFAKVAKIHGRPKYLALAFATKVSGGRRVLHVQKDVITDVTEGAIPSLRVFIDWVDGIPHTRATNRDNINIVFVDPDEANVVMLEVSITSRGGWFWVAIQELYAGQIGRTTTAKAAELELTTIPLDGFAGLVLPVYPENNWPGANFLENFKDAGPGIVRYAAEKGIVRPLSKCCKPQEWNPGPTPTLPEAMAKNGWQVATVLWFNLVIGYGFALLADGSNVFVHFKAIVDEKGRDLANQGEFPLVEASQHIAMKVAIQPDGKRKATAIRIL